MARRPNYGFEKRQKEIEKQKKKEAKLAKKEERKALGLDDEFEGLGLVAPGEGGEEGDDDGEPDDD